MEIVFYLAAAIPLVFAPMVLFDIFALPQTGVLALLSTVGMIVLGVGGVFLFNTPVLLAIALIGYMAVSTSWAEVQEGSRKEFAIQFPLLTFLILSPCLGDGSVIPILTAIYYAGLLNAIYAIGQAFGVDFVFPMRLKMDAKDRRPIGTAGNMNFLSASLLPLFWISVYLAIEIHPTFLIGSVVDLFIFYRAKNRGAFIGLVGSFYLFILFLGFSGFLPSLFPVNQFMLLGILALGAVGLWLYRNWDKINNERIVNDKTTRFATLRYRVAYWKSAWLLIKRKPLQGYGLRSYRKLVYFAQAELSDKDPEYLDPTRYLTPQPRYCHNDWIEDLVEMGIIGTLIKWGLIAYVFYFGITNINGSLVNVFLLTALSAVMFHSIFFFSFRTVGSAITFWILAGLVLLPLPVQAVSFNPWIVAPLMVLALAVINWELVVKDIIGSWYFIHYLVEKKDLGKKERFALTAARWVPKETIYNTHLFIGYLNVAPNKAYKYAQEMWMHYDGMTPGWVVYLNYASANIRIGAKEQAFRHYSTALRMLPSFNTARQCLIELEPGMSLPWEGVIMKVVQEKSKYEIQLMFEKMNNLAMQQQMMQGNIQNIILQEAARLHIPEGWVYDPQLGMFLSPEEMEERQKQQQAQPTQGGQSGGQILPNVVMDLGGPKPPPDGEGENQK